VEKRSSLVSYNKSEFLLCVFVATAMVKNPSKLVLQYIERERMINIRLVFGILKIVVNFIGVTCNLYVGLVEILNSQLRYNFS